MGADNMKRSQAERPITGPSRRALERNQFCQYLDLVRLASQRKDNTFFKVINTEASLDFQCSKIGSYEILLFIFF